MTEPLLDRLAVEDLNGRQIKIIVQTACAIEISRLRMTTKHIAMDQKAVKTFEEDINKIQAKKNNLEKGETEEKRSVLLGDT